MKARFFQFFDVFIVGILVMTTSQLSWASEDSHSLLGSGLRVEALAAFGITFFTLLMVWMSHLRWVAVGTRLSSGLILLNGLALFWIALLPHATARVATNFTDADAVKGYAMVVSAMAASLTALRVYVALRQRDNPAVAKLHSLMTYKAVAGTLLYIGIVPLAEVNTYGALACLVLPPLMFLIEDRHHVWPD
ncbi:MAG: TMEM175 family protein [Caulobacteraceae bacterium]